MFTFSGDIVAIERVAYELCEDQSKQNVIYFEARYSPHLLTNQIPNGFVKELITAGKNSVFIN